MSERNSFYNKVKKKEYLQHDKFLYELFNKKYKFKKSSAWILPQSAGDTFTSDYNFVVDELLALKQTLNTVKSKLNDFPIEQWSSHTRNRNPAGEIQWKLRTEYNAEFVTQAWCKMFECLSSYNIISCSYDSTTFSSVHLCEAPGAFVASVNHYLRSKHPDVTLKWLATTLNPYYEGNEISNTILDDRFLLHTLNNWHFGCDFTGNIMDKNNIQGLRKRCEEIQPVMLVTADGSINCLDSPEEQENNVACLHIYEVLSALSILHSGGSFVLKMFTFFEWSSLSILYLLNIAFEEVNVFKPITSKGGNSEVYLICLNYNREDTILDYVELLIDKITISTVSIFRKDDIPQDFIDQVIDCAKYFMNIQRKVIDNNILHFYKTTSPQVLKNLKKTVRQYFMEHYEVSPIDEEFKIVSGINYYSSFNLNPRIHTGSYNERAKPLNNVDELHLLWSRYSNFQQYHWSLQECMKFIPNDTGDMNELSLSMIFGKPVNKLCSSRFILAPILELYIRAQTLCSNAEIGHNPNLEAWYHVHHDCKLIKEKFLCIVNEKYVNHETNGSNQSYDDYEKQSFKKFLGLNIKEGENIAVWNFPTLTLFSVGVLYILAKHYFENVAFLRYNCIVFFNYKNCNRSYLHEIFSNLNEAKNDKSILSLLPIRNICSGNFYNDVLMFNNANFMYEIFLLLNSINCIS